MDNHVYELENLEDARKFLVTHSFPVIISNKQSTVRSYGMLVLDYIFKILQSEFPQIVKITVNVGDDHAALFTAIKLNYNNIIYTGSSEEAKRIL